MNVTEILLAAQSPDHNRRTEAEKVLRSAEESNFAVYLGTLAEHLAGEENNAESRRLAGLIMKNALYSKNDQPRYSQRWSQAVDAQSKQGIRRLLIVALASQAQEARRAAAQVIAKVANIDLLIPGEWDNLISDLQNGTIADTTKDFLREASLETLGYICEEDGFRDLPEAAQTNHSNGILTAVVHGMNYQGSPTNGTVQTAADIRFTATRALNNVLEFSTSQFETDDARNVIMNTIYKAAKSEDVRMRKAAFEGLVRIAENYYDKLPEYIRYLYEVTDEAIRNDVEEVALQAIEFWSSIAEEEMDLLMDMQNFGDQAQRQSKNFVATALEYLVVPIFESLKKQEDDPLDDSSWNTATAAGSCLELLAQAAPDKILNLVMPFVRNNIGDGANWRSREAAILAFGAVLEGPPQMDVKRLVSEAIPLLIKTLKSDPNIAVRDTTAWTLARSIPIDRDTTTANLPALVECLRGTLASAENPVLAAHICFAINNVAESYGDEAEQPTGTLGEHVEVLLRAILQAADREDASEGNLRLHAYEALNTMFRCVSLDAVVFVNRCVPLLLEKLEKSIEATAQALSRDEVNEHLEIQGLLCNALSNATPRLDMQQLSLFADRMMQAYLHLFGRAGDDKTIHEDALVAVGAIADKAGKEFSRYMQHFMPVLTQSLDTTALQQDEKHSIVSLAVAVVGDIARGLGAELTVVSDNIMFLLLEALKSPTLNRSVKPPILVCMGDMALALKGNFEKYLTAVMDCMKQAAQSTVAVAMNVEQEDYDTQDWIMSLRESIFEAYIGIINGLQADHKQELLMPHVEWLVAFSELVDRDAQAANAVGSQVLCKAVAGVLGDLVDAIQTLKADFRQRQWVYSLLNRCGQSPDDSMRETAKWAMQTIYQE